MAKLYTLGNDPNLLNYEHIHFKFYVHSPQWLNHPLRLSHHHYITTAKLTGAPRACWAFSFAVYLGGNVRRAEVSHFTRWHLFVKSVLKKDIMEFSAGVNPKCFALYGFCEHVNFY